MNLPLNFNFQLKEKIHQNMQCYQQITSLENHGAIHRGFRIKIEFLNILTLWFGEKNSNLIDISTDLFRLGNKTVA